MSNATAKWVQTGTVPLVLNGKDVETETTFPVISAKTNKFLWSASGASVEDAIKAADIAQGAFAAWSKTKPHVRRDIFLKAADIIDRRREELGYYVEHEMGANGFFKDLTLDLATEHLRDVAGRIAGAVAGTLPEPFQDGMKAMVQKRPYGVILGIAPWNGAYPLGLRSALYPIAAGNTVVLKGSELTPGCYWAIADVLREAGLPDGVLNLVLHRPEDAAPVVNALIAHPAVRKINFTGSSRIGAIVAAEAGKHLKPTLLELGGKANVIILEDADLKNAALSCSIGAFVNAGQVCMSTERILVHKSVAQQFEAIFKEIVDQMFGSPETTPILVTAASAQRNRALIADAKSKGASTLDFLKDPTTTQEDVETHMRPVVLTKLEKAMDIYSGESFGPSVSLYTFDSIEEAIELANDTKYGLSAAVHTENLKIAFRIADQLESGAVHINSMTVHDETALPHGGVKASGFGRFNSNDGLNEFLYSKAITWIE
ncbi:aldehyde dehydrogenase [Xylariales sp. PMI_506]|nr:aldehyde dehydrogenase [Xylariales sp. PMI_506]